MQKIIWFLVGLALGAAMEVNASDLDTTTIEILIIQRQYEFGFPKIDTISSLTHIYRPGLKDWYIKFHEMDWSSDKKPIVLKRMKRR
jgi:hypothetical protein